MKNNKHISNTSGASHLPRLIASDIGGTLLQGSDILPEFTAAVLNRLVNTGVPVALITGYNYTTTMKYTGNLDEKILLMPLNGTLCIREQKLVWEYHIPEKEAREIHDILVNLQLPVIVYTGQSQDFKNYYISPDDLPLSDAFQKIDTLPGFENITGISTILPDDIAQSTRAKIQEIVGDRFKVIYTREFMRSWLEVVHADVRKDLALKRLCNELSISLSHVSYFGDNFNDVEVLRSVGHPVLVDNAQDELKAEFRTIVKSVTEEGVAHYLNRLFSLGVEF